MIEYLYVDDLFTLDDKGRMVVRTEAQWMHGVFTTDPTTGEISISFRPVPKDSAERKEDER